jgi:DNA-binding transcriptional LysR family regulator
MNPRDLDPELLRAFVAVVDGGGFTRAAARLHRTQSTVSQQLKRLEERLGTPLLQRNTRSVALTERGELLLGYARRLLALNDEALAALAETRLHGDVRLGSAQEVADGGLADLLAHFSRLHPGVRLEVRVDANLRLREAVERGELDLAVLFQEPGQGNGGSEVMERMRRVWVASPQLRIADGEPLPLVLPVGPCIFRNAVLGALDAAGRPWRIVLSTPSLAGIRAAVRAGLGVGVRTERWLEADLRILDRGLPPLPDVELALISAGDTGKEVVDRLRAALREALSQPPAGSPKGHH